MRFLRKMLGELFGLFVDDGAFAAAVVIWLAFVALLLPRLNAARTWGGAVLFAGLAVILIASPSPRLRR